MFNITFTDQETHFLETIVREFEDRNPSEWLGWMSYPEIATTKQMLSTLASEQNNVQLTAKGIEFLQAVIEDFLHYDSNQTLSATETPMAEALLTRLATTMQTQSAANVSADDGIFEVFGGPSYDGDTGIDPDSVDDLSSYDM